MLVSLTVNTTGTKLVSPIRWRRESTQRQRLAVGYHTKFNVAGGLDLDNQIRDLISVLLPAYADRPYATAERLAEAGIRQLAARIEAKESLADILEELGSGRDRGAYTTLAPIDGDREQNSDHAT